MGGSFKGWENEMAVHSLHDEGWGVERARYFLYEEERQSASLSELKLLSRLTILSIDVDKEKLFPDEFLLPNLLKFHLTVGPCSCYENFYPKSRRLTLRYIQTALASFDKTLPLKKVEELTLSHVWGMRDISVLIPYCSVGKLRDLWIDNCHELLVILPAYLVHWLNFLEEVTVERCQGLQVIFQLNEVVAKEEHAMVLSSLRKLKLFYWPRLFSIWNGSCLFVNLCNLTVLEIKHCEKLSNIFSLSIAQSLLNLESLKINTCENLETIVAEDQGMAALNNNCIQPVIFPKLKFIEVEYCNRLTSLFTITTARGLVKLKEVRLLFNQQLLEIVCHGGKGEEEGDEKEILFPQLHLLQLVDMQRLERLCPGSFHMHLPSLKELVVKKCPTLKNFPADSTAFGLKMHQTW